MKAVIQVFRVILTWVLLTPVYIYRYVISPVLPASCRYTPTCSQYAVDAIKIHGPFKGFVLGLWRILRCNPWGGHGFDPVPTKKVKSEQNKA